MATAASTPTLTELEPWVRFLHAHASIVGELSSELVAEHGLTINDYEVLLRLSRAEGRRMRRVDIAQEVLLSPSGITRLLEGLEKAGLRRAADVRERPPRRLRMPDRRGDAQAAPGRQDARAGISRVFLDRFDEDERVVLAELLGRLSAADDGPCTPE